MRSRFLLLILLVLSAASLRAQITPHALLESTPRFTENRGQIVDVLGRARPDILFTARTPNARLYLRTSGLSYVFARIDEKDSAHLQSAGARDQHRSELGHPTLYRMDVEFVGASSAPRITREGVGEDYTNYYLPHCPNGLLGVRNYGRVTYHDLYPKIDLVLRSTDSGVKSEFVVHPGGDPSKVRFRYVGSSSVGVLEDGRLHVATMLGGLDESAPYSFTEGVTRDEVPSRFIVDGGEVGFLLGWYDRSRPLIIDPLTRTWATCVGGGVADLSLGVSTSRDGGVYVGGQTMSTDFPVTVGAFQTTGGGSNADLFLMRFTPAGSRRWATYIGGTGEEIAGTGRMISTGWNNDVALVGSSWSSNFPTTVGAPQRTNSGTAIGVETNEDAIVAVFDNTGARRWATYLGGSRDANGVRLHNFDRASAVAYDRAGNIVVTGYAYSYDFPITAGAFQSSNKAGVSGAAFVSKFNPVGVLFWSTFLSGNGGSAGNDVAVGENNRIYIAGQAGSEFPTTSGAYQTAVAGGGCAFVAMFDSIGGRNWATYFGPTTSAQGVAVDAAGAVTITGITPSPMMPTTPGAYRTTYTGGLNDVFVAKLSANGSQLLRSTYFGGEGDDRAYGLLLDRQGGVWVSGSTTTTAFPVSASAFQMTYAGGSSDAFLLQFDSAGRLLYSSLYGGDGNSGQDVSTDIACDSSGGFYLAGYTESVNFPSSPGAFQSKPAGVRDAFFVKFECQAPTPVLDSLGMLCAGDTTSRVILTAPGGYRSYRWSTGDSTRSLAVRNPGGYILTVIDSMGCSSLPYAVSVREQPRTDVVVTSSMMTLCPGDSALLQAIVPGPHRYRWNTGSTAQRIVIRDSGLYSVVATDSNGCSTSAWIRISASRLARPSIKAAEVTWICPGDSLLLSASSEGYTSWQWSNGQFGREIVVRDSGRYTVATVDVNGCYQVSAPVNIRWRAPVKARIIPQGSTTRCAGDSVLLFAFPGGAAKYEWSNGAINPAIFVRTSGLYKVIVTDQYGCRDSASITVTISSPSKPVLVAGGTALGKVVRLCEGDSLLVSTAIPYVNVAWSDGVSGWRRTLRQSGRYVAQVWDASGCSNFTDTLEVIVARRPVLNLSGAVAVCAGSRSGYAVTPQPGVQYLWSAESGMIIGGQGSAAITVQWGGAGSGWVRLEGADQATGCRTTDSIRVDIGNVLQPLVRASRSTTLCPGDSVVLDAGDGYATYQWSTGATSRTITVHTAGDYTVSVQDADGCGGTSAPVSVRLNVPPTPTVSSTAGPVLCAGDSTTLSVAGTFASYRWSTGETTPTIVVRSAGDYGVEVADTVGCIGNAVPFTLGTADAPRPRIDGPNAVCGDAEGTYVVGDSIALPVIWSVEGGDIVSGQGTRQILVRWGAPGTAEVVATAANTVCSRSEHYQVQIATALHPHLEGAGINALCVGDSLELVAPRGYASYRWNTGESGSRIVVRSAGEYWVEVEALEGCRGKSDTVIVVDAVPSTPRIAVDSPFLCAGDSTLLDAGADYRRYRWSTGDTTRTIVVRSAGRYSVAVQGVFGECWNSSDTLDLLLRVGSVPAITSVGDELEADAGVHYQWWLDGAIIDGATQRRHRPSRSGNYTVTVVDTSGCAATSAPYAFDPSTTVSHQLVLNTIEGRVGEWLTMDVRITPPLAVAEGVTGYRVQVGYDPRAIYLLRVTSGMPGLPDPALVHLGEGSAEIVGSSSDMLSGSLLARLEMMGLVTGQPVNILGVERAELIGGDSLGIAEGIVLLSGCDIGRTGGFDRAVTIVGVRWTGNEVDVRYRAPVGSAPQLVVYDLMGRVVDKRTLDEGTGTEQQARVGEGLPPSGMYRLELRDRAERDGAIIVLQQ